MKTRQGLGPDTLPDVAIDDTVAASASDLRPSAPRIDPGTPGPDQPARGDSIGRFVVLGILGAGGMGVVYSAYDPHLDRKVAIKVLGDAASHNEDAKVRLLREAQAMAKINHANVIKVHEVGTYGEQVFVAMEFADAGTLRAWLKQAPRSRREIIDVFSEAGRGLGAAHAAGLVHRDFKPDNVLMALDGSIRVTDFGLVSVADEPPRRATSSLPVAAEQQLTDDTPLSQDLTRTGSIMGTPTYMAPEQFSGRGATARTDQFAFCVALYEALYGERPFSGSNYHELMTAVLLGEVLPAPRGSQVPTWIRRVLSRGLAVDPANRYSAMSDLLRALAHDPVRRRNRVLAWSAGIGAVGIAVVAAVALRPDRGAECRAGSDRIAEIWNGTQRARLQAAFTVTGRPHAAASFTRFDQLVDDWGRGWQLAYADACEDTRVRGEQSDHLLDLRMQCLSRRLADTKATIELLAAGGPDVADRGLSAALALPLITPCNDTAALTAAVAPPETEAMRLQVLAVRGQLDAARAQRRLGRYDKGLEVARAGLAAARASKYAPVIGEALLVAGTLEQDSADKASVATLREAMHAAAASGDSETMIDAATWLVFGLTNETDQYATASEIGQLADAMRQHAHPSAEVVVRLDNTIALLDAKRGNATAAQQRYERALTFAREQLGADHPGTMSTLNQLGNLEKEQGRFAQARAHIEQALASRERVLGKDHPDVASVLNNLGNVYRAEGKLDDAKRAYDRALAIRIAALGEAHPEVGTSYNNLGTFYSDAGDEATAQTHFERALANWEKAYGKDHIEVAGALMNVGTSQNARGDGAGARVKFERARTIVEAAKGPDHPQVATILSNIGVVALEEKRYDEAKQLFERAEQIARKAYGPEHPDVADYLGNLTTVYKAQGKLREAQELTQRTLGVMAKAYGADHPRMGGALINYGNLQFELRDHRGAIETYKRALAIFESSLGEKHPYVAYALNGIGSAFIEQNQHAAAVPPLERALAIRVATDQRPGDIAEVRYNLAQALAASPATRARARDEGKTALAEYQKANDADQVLAVRQWLAQQKL